MKTDGATTEVGLLGNVVKTGGFSTVDVNVGGATTEVGLRTVVKWGSSTVDLNVGGATTEVGFGGLEVTKGVGTSVGETAVCDITSEVTLLSVGLGTVPQVAVTDNFVGIITVGGQSISCRTTKVTTRSDGNSVGTINVPITRCDT